MQSDKPITWSGQYVNCLINQNLNSWATAARAAGCQAEDFPGRVAWWSRNIENKANLSPAGAGASLSLAKITAKIVASNVVASRPPERRPTATPTACANNCYMRDCLYQLYKEISWATANLIWLKSTRSDPPLKNAGDFPQPWFTLLTCVRPIKVGIACGR